MSERSAAWYTVPENKQRRQANMRSYISAMTQLGQRYPDYRRRVYRREMAGGMSHAKAYQRALAAVRDAHSDEFRRLVTRLREAV